MSRRTILAAAGCGLLLAACATMAPRPAPPPPAGPAPAAAAPSPPRTVFVRTPPPAKASCVPKAFPRAPKYPDTDAALRDAGGAADRYQLMAAGRILRARRLADLERAVDACR